MGVAGRGRGESLQLRIGIVEQPRPATAGAVDLGMSQDGQQPGPWVATVEAVDEIYNDLIGKDVPFTAPPAAYDWNAYCCYFSDPDGNLWEVYCWVGDGAEGYHKLHS